MTLLILPKLLRKMQNTEVIKRISKISFSPINPSVIKKYSSCKVISTDLYTKNREPKFEGINDTRMGTTDHNIKCDTCQSEIDECPGHFGHIELCSPIYNPIFISKLVMILNVFCSLCSNLLFDKTNIILLTSKKQKRISIIYKHNVCKKIFCGKCNFLQSNIKYSKDGMVITKADLKEQIKSKFYATETLKIINKISESDLRLIGIDPEKSHPRFFIFTNFVVVPPCVRPSINFGCNLRSEDDIVYKLTNIVKANKSLDKKLKSANQKYLEVYQDSLQWACTTLIDNNIKSIPQSQHRNNGRPLKSIKERIKGKEGRIRGHILGKRVNQSARTVIDPDPNLKIQEVGIPIKICKILTFPEVVNVFNYQEMNDLINKGPLEHPGANYVKKKNGITIDLKYRNKKDITLEYGDIILRHIQHGDWVLFNRQPSLHRCSMMGHQVVPVKGKAFRLNPGVTKPYNADFDGDEMNIIVPQNYLSSYEISYITAVNKQIISPQSGTPIIGNIMDNVLAPYILSKPSCFLTESQLYNSILKLPQFNDNAILPPPSKIVKNKKLWSGKAIFSMLLPNTLDYRKKGIRIKDGNLLHGILTKSHVGASPDGLIHQLVNDFDYETASSFINHLQTFTNRFFKFKGFSVGFNDIKRNDNLKKQNLKIIQSAKEKVQHYIQRCFGENTKMSMQEFEQYIFNTLNKARDDIGALVMKNIDGNNAFYQMINSKSKGNILNISQIMGSVGQQNIQWSGKSGRVPLIINNRSLPYFHQFDSTPAARGFIKHSYVDGLEVDEFFFHMQAGREGVIDTACKTADVGYLQRKLIKSLEDIKFCYDFTVRNEGNRIVQFAYGTNNIDTVKLEKKKFSLISMTKQEFDELYKWKFSDLIKDTDTYTFKIFKIFKILKNEYKILKAHRRYFAKKNTSMLYFIEQSYNVLRNIQSIKKTKCSNCPNCPELSPVYIYEENEKLLHFIRLNCQDNVFPFNEIKNYNLKETNAWLLSCLASKKLILHDKLNTCEYDKIINLLKKQFYDNLIDPGTSVGILSTQSIGEPCTQLSVSYATKVKMFENGELKSEQIGAIIDKYMNKHKNKTIEIKVGNNQHSSYILPIPETWNIKVPGINISTQKVQIAHVTEFSKHKPNGKLVKIVTVSGKTVIGTLSHSFITKKNKKIVKIRGSELKVGDVIPRIRIP